MKRIALAVIAVLALALACSGEPKVVLKPPFDVVIPACDSEDQPMDTTNEGTFQSGYYGERGEVHHQRHCSLDDATVRMSVSVYETGKEAKHALDELVSYLSSNASGLSGEVLDWGSSEYLFAEPSWFETALRWWSFELYEAPAAGVDFRIGRYVGHTEIGQQESNSIVTFENEQLMYKMANRLVAGLHELAVLEGVLPTLSGAQAIQLVTEHIEHGEPISYLERRAASVTPDPPECDILLEENEYDEYFEQCAFQPFQAWEEAGRPTFDYKWSEDVECWEWDRWVGREIEGVKPFRLDVDRIPWEARFYREEDIAKQDAELNNLLQQAEQLDDASHLFESDAEHGSKLGSLPEAFFEPHWVVTGAPSDDGGCFWILREGQGVAYAAGG